MVPKHIRTYLTVNLALAVFMAVVMAVRAELRTGRHILIDGFLIIFYSTVLASLFFGPFAIVEIYLYRRKKGTWYEWKHQTRARRSDRSMSPDERWYWRSEAYRVRTALAPKLRAERRPRTQLFQEQDPVDAVSRPAILMTVADRFERSGKREAAERCYVQVVERFPDSPQAKEAARRLAVSAGT